MFRKKKAPQLEPGIPFFLSGFFCGYSELFFIFGNNKVIFERILINNKLYQNEHYGTAQ